MLKIEVIEFEAQDVITASTAASDDFVDFEPGADMPPVNVPSL